MSFGYKNRELLELLEKRGESIGLGKFKKTVKMNRKIVEHIDKEYEEIRTPVCAFVTFTT